MKKIALVISMLMLMLALAACGAKQSEPATEENTDVATEEAVEETVEDPVAGNTYVATSTTVGEETREIGPEDKPASFVFGTDNTVQYHGYDENMEETVTEGTYTVNGDVVTITFAGNDESFDHTISGDTLTFTTEIDGTKSIDVYTKQ